MRLNDIKDNAGARKFRVRVGRGIGSGLGKQAGRGGKGQTARSGLRIGGFEGGLMPKRGFNKWRQKDMNEINLGALQKAIDEKKIDPSKPIDNAALVAAGVLRRPKDGLRVLGTGELKWKVAITADHATASAKAAIEKAGGSVKIIEKKILAADVAKAKKTAAKKAKAAGGGAKKAGADE